MMNYKQIHLLIVGLLALALSPGAFADDAAQVFDQLYGQQVKAALATRDNADDLALAARLLDAARQSTDTPALLKQLCDHAYEMAARFPAGFDTADAAMQLLADNTPAGSNDQMTAYDKLATLRRRGYFVSRGDAKQKAGEAYIDVLTALAHATSTTNADTAGNDLRQALGVASAIQSPRAEAIRKQYEQLNAIRIVQHRVADLRDQLKKDPKNAKAAEDLIKLYVVDLDEPAEAAKLTFLLPGSDWAKNLPLAVLDPSKLTLTEASSLGDWYRGLAAKETHSDAKAAMLRHADADYQQALASHPGNSLQAQKLNLLLADVQSQLTQLGVSPSARALSTRSTSPPAMEASSGRSINLLAAVDVHRDAVSGTWTVARDGSITSPQQGVLLLAPLIPPHTAYRLEADFSRTSGNDVNFVLPIEDHSVRLVIGFMAARQFDGLDVVHDKVVCGSMPQLPIENGRTYHVAAEVKPVDDQYTVSVWIDDQLKVTTTASADAFSTGGYLGEPEEKVARGHIIVRCYNTIATLSRLVLRPVSDQVQPSHDAASMPGPASKLVAAGGGIELIPHIQFPADAVHGAWTKDSGVIRGDREGDSRFKLPFAVHGDFRLTLGFTRVDGDDRLTLVGPIGSRLFEVSISESPNLGGISGIAMVNHTVQDPANPTTVKGKPINNNRPQTLVIEVRTPTADTGSINVTIDDKPLLHWKGPLEEMLKTFARDSVPGEGAIGIASWDATYEFRSIRLQMLSGSAVPIAVPSMANLVPVGPPTYLSDMQEQDVHVLNYQGIAQFGKGGVGPDNTGPIRVAGVHSPHGLFTHPATGDPAHVSYALNGQYHLLRGAIGVSDSAADPESALWFTVLGDGKILWRSRPLRRRGVVQPFNIDVSGIKMLELRVWAAGGDSSAHASWIEPALYRSASRTNGLQVGDLNASNSAPVNSSNRGAATSHAGDTNSNSGGKFFGIPTN